MRFQEDWYLPTFEQLTDFFKAEYFDPIIELLNDDRRFNSLSDVTSAIQAGQIKFKNGEFSGKFNAAISRELSKFAKFDRRTKTWKAKAGIQIPASIRTAAANANARMSRTIDAINVEIDRMTTDIPGVIPQMNFTVDDAVKQMVDGYGNEVRNIGVFPDVTPEFLDTISREYSDNLKLWIEKFHPEQIKRLREMVFLNIEQGMNRKALRKQLEAEFGISARKANFLARQETTLLSAAIRDERYGSAGVKFYKWSTANDQRVVGNPGGVYPNPSSGHGNHWALEGKICRLDDPSVYADSIADAKKSKWKTKRGLGCTDTHPGQDYLCRCTSIPIVG